MRSRKSIGHVVAAGVVLGLAAAACSASQTAGPLTSGSPPPGAGSGLLLRIATGDGFVMPADRLREFPEVSVFADGHMIVAGAQIEIYPPPALPPMMQTRLTPAGLEKVRRAAIEAGLEGPDRNYDNPRIADAPTTTFTFAGQSEQPHVTKVYAMSIGEPFGEPDAEAKDSQDRRKLAELRNKLTDASFFGDDAAPQEPYTAEAMAVFLLEVAPDDAGLERSKKQWPLQTGLDAFGEPAPENSFFLRCGVVRGDDLATLQQAARESNTRTVWTSGQTERELVFRPLLPDEKDCPRA